MKKKLPGICPVCEERMAVTALACPACGTTVGGNFELSKFDYLPPEEQNFALVFLKNAGNIKQIERELGVSYPTVKKTLESVIAHLGFEGAVVTPADRPRVLEMLKNGEIGFDEAEMMLGEEGV